MKCLATVYATSIRGCQNEKQYCFARMDRLTVRYSGLGVESTKLELTAIIPKMFWAHFYWSKRWPLACIVSWYWSLFFYYWPVARH